MAVLTAALSRLTNAIITRRYSKTLAPVATACVAAARRASQRLVFTIIAHNFSTQFEASMFEISNFIKETFVSAA